VIDALKVPQDRPVKQSVRVCDHPNAYRLGCPAHSFNVVCTASVASLRLSRKTHHAMT